jgi:transcriptional regulator with XRE-family HTH domain
MTSYTKWDRAAYIERAGGEEEAERRRRALMARQSGQRLAEERKRHGLTQAQLAQAMGVTPGRVSQIERGELATIDAVARYIEALGGRLDLIASFGDHTHRHHNRSSMTRSAARSPGCQPRAVDVFECHSRGMQTTDLAALLSLLSVLLRRTSPRAISDSRECA